jgi:hypothetical protein
MFAFVQINPGNLPNTKSTLFTLKFILVFRAHSQLTTGPCFSTRPQGQLKPSISGVDSAAGTRADQTSFGGETVTKFSNAFVTPSLTYSVYRLNLKLKANLKFPEVS